MKQRFIVFRSANFNVSPADTFFQIHNLLDQFPDFSVLYSYDMDKYHALSHDYLNNYPNFYLIIINQFHFSQLTRNDLRLLEFGTPIFELYSDKTFHLQCHFNPIYWNNEFSSKTIFIKNFLCSLGFPDNEVNHSIENFHETIKYHEKLLVDKLPTFDDIRDQIFTDEFIGTISRGWRNMHTPYLPDAIYRAFGDADEIVRAIHPEIDSHWVPNSHYNKNLYIEPRFIYRVCELFDRKYKNTKTAGAMPAFDFLQQYLLVIAKLYLRENGEVVTDFHRICGLGASTIRTNYEPKFRYILNHTV